MRTLAFVFGMAALVATLGGCRQVSRTWESAKCCVGGAVSSAKRACAPDPCAQPSPVYPNGCGGDQGVGRGGTGAFGRP
jgi:hypothetical protein